MSNEKKNQTIDYSKFFEQRKKKPVPVPEKEGWRFALGGFRNFWAAADKKLKVELVILILVVTLTLIILIFYLAQTGPKSPEELYAPPAVENWEEQQ